MKELKLRGVGMEGLSLNSWAHHILLEIAYIQTLNSINLESGSLS